ncbi:tRNA (adenosine(37)-N6)-threonylcarbamoyltransferase complex ATPase subunit type 1 TsaE [Periweissella fabalis]|uniref:tRNA threonylcarbamoyladenosine biosynthesis protein TsaE n=1 Tax=Periweissella fabalis TaxID=1070421 RepID=A0A7X6N3E6_9LACO|nr:tRNA (adenosine(37)-N6)-threonylcarbamoyltransferase complex ATPase subunit type 1 TsaE [Periweissella fabalis]MCM0598692.1 tRNA (adenosine(37)-N6)-threonylcarbamoyltransferase complex ATPase subunit type 1 TsaE [Periweissella fabalis]NKZ24345.1 tRNA (adenosine(37)-N6)-threonylcarbamoyltransferase complex ATPase subunit type 1 TsaE [Periweissella fabalis]
MKTFKINNSETTQALGQRLGQIVSPGDVILLDGDLGAGKTTFTKGIALGLGIQRNIKSPTFTIIREYKTGRLPLYHMDVYRLEDGGGDELGLDEYFNGNGVCVIEWSQFVANELPKNHLTISFKRDDSNLDSTNRTITITASDAHYEGMMAQL